MVDWLSLQWDLLGTCACLPKGPFTLLTLFFLFCWFSYYISKVLRGAWAQVSGGWGEFLWGVGVVWIHLFFDVTYEACCQITSSCVIFAKLKFDTFNVGRECSILTFVQNVPSKFTVTSQLIPLLCHEVQRCFIADFSCVFYCFDNMGVSRVFVFEVHHFLQNGGAYSASYFVECGDYSLSIEVLEF